VSEILTDETSVASSGKRRRVAKPAPKLNDLSLSDNNDDDDEDLYVIEEKKPKGKGTPTTKPTTSTSRAKKTPLRRAAGEANESFENNENGHFGMNGSANISGIEHDKSEKPAGMKIRHF
jgi:hypothetical protein